MASPHSDIPQCINSNEAEEMNQSEEKLQSHPLPYADELPTHHHTVSLWDQNWLCKEKLQAEASFKQPRDSVCRSIQTGEICNLIFFSDHPSAWHKAITKHYPSVKKKASVMAGKSKSENQKTLIALW